MRHVGVKPGDRVILYFACHGFLDQGEASLIPYDGLCPEEGKAVSREIDTWISAYTFQRMFGPLSQNAHLLALLNTCYAAKFIKESWQGHDPGEFSDRLERMGFYERQRLHPSNLVIAAAAMDEPILEGTNNDATQFTKRLGRALKGVADKHPQDGIVTATEIFQYLVESAKGDIRDPKPHFGFLWSRQMSSDRASTQPFFIVKNQ